MESVATQSLDTKASFFDRNYEFIRKVANRHWREKQRDGTCLNLDADDISSEIAKKLLRAYFSSESKRSYVYQSDIADRSLINSVAKTAVTDAIRKSKQDSKLLAGISLDSSDSEDEDTVKHHYLWLDPLAEQEIWRVADREYLLGLISKIPNERYRDILKALLRGEEPEISEGYVDSHPRVMKSRALAELKKQIRNDLEG